MKNWNLAHKYVDPEFKTFLILRELCVKDTFGVHSKASWEVVYPFIRLDCRVEIGYLLELKLGIYFTLGRPRYQGN